jgi:hypothetical protein
MSAVLQSFDLLKLPTDVIRLIMFYDDTMLQLMCKLFYWVCKNTRELVLTNDKYDDFASCTFDKIDLLCAIKTGSFSLVKYCHLYSNRFFCNYKKEPDMIEQTAKIGNIDIFDFIVKQGWKVSDHTYTLVVRTLNKEFIKHVYDNTPLYKRQLVYGCFHCGIIDGNTGEVLCDETYNWIIQTFN